MKRDQITGLICCGLFLGTIAISCLVGTCDILSLKISSEEINGSNDLLNEAKNILDGYSLFIRTLDYRFNEGEDGKLDWKKLGMRNEE